MLYLFLSGDSCATIAKSFHNCGGGVACCGKVEDTIVFNFSGCDVSHVTVRAITEVLSWRCCCCRRCNCTPFIYFNVQGNQHSQPNIQLLHPPQQQPQNHRQASCNIFSRSFEFCFATQSQLICAQTRRGRSSRGRRRCAQQYDKGWGSWLQVADGTEYSRAGADLLIYAPSMGQAAGNNRGSGFNFSLFL